jgi:hypothetical protein
MWRRRLPTNPTTCLRRGRTYHHLPGPTRTYRRLPRLTEWLPARLDPPSSDSRRDKWMLTAGRLQKKSELRIPPVGFGWLPMGSDFLATPCRRRCQEPKNIFGADSRGKARKGAEHSSSGFPVRSPMGGAINGDQRCPNVTGRYSIARRGKGGATNGYQYLPMVTELVDQTSVKSLFKLRKTRRSNSRTAGEIGADAAQADQRPALHLQAAGSTEAGLGWIDNCNSDLCPNRKRSFRAVPSGIWSSC